MSEPTIINNYSIDVRQLMADIVKNEQKQITANLLKLGILNPSEDGDGFYAISYTNFVSRNEEGHQPDLKLIKLGEQSEQNQETNDESN